MHYSTTKRPALRRAHKVVIAITCSLGIVGNASAQEVVTDPGVLAQTITTVTNTASTAANTLNTVTNTANTVTQITSTIGTIVSNPLAALIPPNSDMTELSTNQITALITAKCPTTSTGGNIVASALSSAVQSLDSSTSNAAQQQRICSNTVFVQADEYNATVDLYKQMPQLHNTVGTLQGMMQKLNGVMGNSSSAAAQTNNFTAAEQDEVNQWSIRVQMDKNIIDTLNQQQSILAAVSLSAQPDLLGSSVQAAALALAFTPKDQ